MLGVFKKILFWSYGRTRWQYDVLSVLILAFVFLTPPGWFRTGEPKAFSGHQNSVLTATGKRLVSPEHLPATPGTEDFERHLRAELRRPEVRVKGWQVLRDAGGRVAAYEVDIE
ncbi:MAG TPA: hypothetical protein VIP46_11175 [Pyrinomonadaceae bacterium]